MAGSGLRARHGYVQLAAKVGVIAVFSISTGLYGLPLTVLLSLIASCAYCGVTYISFTLEGRQWRRALGIAYDRIFKSAYGDASLLARRAVGAREKDQGRVALQCHKEAQKMTQLIMRDFVEEWYQNVSVDLEFPDDCQKVLEHVSLEINIRMHQINLDEVVHELLAAILPYLEAVNQAGKLEYNGVEIFDVKHERCLRRLEENQAVAHRALRSLEAETRYYRQLLDAVIQCALPDEYRNCDLAGMFLREILLHNIVEPLLTLFCDPDFLNKAIPKILRKADPVEVQTILDHIQVENKQLEHSLQNGRFIQAHRRPPNTRRFHSMSESQTMKPIPVPLSIVCEAPLRAMPSEMGVEEVDVGEAEEEDEEGEEEREDRYERERLHSETDEVDAPPFSPSPTSSICSSNSSQVHEDTPPFLRKLSLIARHSPFSSRKTSRRQTIAKINSSRAKKIPPAVARSDLAVARGAAAIAKSNGVASSSSLESDPDLVYIDLPPIFANRHIHIVQGNSTHIGYVFKFPKNMLSHEDLQELELPSDETHLESVKRYSEFTQLHQQLLRSPQLAKQTQGLDLPERHGFASVMSKLPFTSRDLDPTSLLERKQGLEKYIQLLSARAEILESRLFQGFLKSGVVTLRDTNTQNTHKSRRRTLLGMMKGHTEEEEEAKALPKRLMESVLSSYLNTSLPLPCRKLNSAPNGSVITGKTRLPAEAVVGGKQKPVLTKAATIGECSASDSGRTSMEDSEELRRFSSSDLEGSLTRGVGDNLPIENESEISCGVRKTTPTPVESSDITHSHKARTQPLPNGTSSDDASSRYPTTSEMNIFSRAKNHFLHFTSLVWYYANSALTILQLCSHTFTRSTLLALTKKQQTDSPLGDVLLSLGTEASKNHCEELWVTDKATQLAVLTLFGGAIDRYLLQELHIVVEKEQNWARALYHLRHTLWVEGSKELDRSPREKLTEGEREERKKKAADAFKKFLPNFLPYIVGSEDYSHAITHCMECLQNPRINRHFFLRVVDILLPRLVPELHSEEFQKKLARLRTLTSTHAHKIPHSRPLSTHLPSNHTYSKK